MKRLNKLILIVAAMFMVACGHYMDINTNPNSPTSVTPNLILPQALTATSFVLNGYNTYGSQLGGYVSNAGGYGGFNEYVTYSYTSASWGMWGPTYDNMEDYQYIMDKTANDPANIYFYAVATIMRAHGFQLLVDAYNDVPYSQALKGANSLTPTYDKGATIYAGLAVDLDSAMARINRGNAMATKNPIDKYDILFHGDMSKWMQLANTLKLRLIVRGTNNSGTKVSFANTGFDPNGGVPFLTTDALINPGFTRDVNRENPAWNGWAYTYTGTAGNKAWVPTLWSLSWVDGTNLSDLYRGTASIYEYGKITTNTITGGTLYKPGTYTKVNLTTVTGGTSISAAVATIVVSAAGVVTGVTLTDSKGYNIGDVLSANVTDIGGTGSGFKITVSAVEKSTDIANQLGRETVDAPKCPTGGRWYPGFDRTGTSAGLMTGTLKGPDAGYPLLTAAESHFLQAEASLTGIALPGGSEDDVTGYRNGVTASFSYLSTLPNLSVVGNPSAEAAKYMDVTNAGNYRADYSSASGVLQKTEAIITQKYIALNYVNSHEGFNEFRRTGYPTVTLGARTATNTFASTVSNQTSRPDGLPTRIQYPTSEAQYNPINLPAGIDTFTQLIFWAK